VNIPFIKIEGLGNDYIYVDKSRFVRKKVNFPSLARAISDRRRGVGADGLIVMEKLGPDSASMVIYNRDGSEARFCGNGLRGTALYFRNVYKAKRNRLNIATRWSEYSIRVVRADRSSAMVCAFLGSPSFDPVSIGLNAGMKTGLGIEMLLNSRKRLVYCVALPNPHAVMFVDNFDFSWQEEGAALEKSPIFKNGTNVMFTKVDSTDKLTIFPWERGSGATAACGSGAAAATVISSLLGYTRGNVTSNMPGGSLVTRWDIEENQIYQEGPTRIAFSGSYIH